eukprot:s1562_g2.t1
MTRYFAESSCSEKRLRPSLAIMAAARRSAFSIALAGALALLALRASLNFVAWAGAPPAPRSSVALRASIMAKEETSTKTGKAGQQGKAGVRG